MSWASAGGRGQTCRFCLCAGKRGLRWKPFFSPCQSLRGATALGPVIPRDSLCLKKILLCVCEKEGEIDLGMQVSWYTFGRQKTA